MNSWLRVLIAGVLGLALGVSTTGAAWLVLAACVVVVLCFAFGWPLLVDSPHPWSASVLLVIVGLFGVGSVWLAEPQALLFWLPVLGGLGLLATFVLQLVRGPNDPGVVLQIAGQVTGVLTVLAIGTWLAAARAPGDGDVVIVSVIALVVALAVTVIPWPARFTSPLAIVLGAGVALAAALGLHEVGRGGLPLPPAAAIGAVLGLLVAAVHRLLGMAIYVTFPRGHTARLALHPGKDEAGGPAAEGLPLRRASRAQTVGLQIALGATPLALGGVVVYAAERLFVG